MLTVAETADHFLLKFAKDDPVRPEIPAEFRVHAPRFMAALVDQQQPQAIVCVSAHNTVPRAVSDLARNDSDASIAVFYTIWSYQPGRAAPLLMSTVQWLREHRPWIQRFVTLSPKTQLAHRFHTNNGAVVLAENADTINYEYQGELCCESRTGT